MLERRGQAGLGEPLGGVAQQSSHLLERAVRIGVELRCGPAEQRRERRQPHPAGAVRLLQGLQQPEPVPGGRRAEDAGAAGQHAGDARRVQRRLHHRPVHVLADEDGDVAGLHRCGAAVERERCRAVQQPDDVGGDVGGDLLPHPADRGEAAAAQGSGARAVQHPQPERRRTGHPPLGVVGGDGRRHDLRVAEGGAAVQVVQRGEQRRVAAPVGAERLGPVGVGAGRQVGQHLGAAEGVDRLLRVADEDQVGVAVEGGAQDLPLHRVGVLELVDQHDGEALPQPRARRRPAHRVAQHRAEQREQVVEVAHGGGALAPVQLGLGRPRQPDALAGRGGRVGVGRLEPRGPVPDGGPRDLARVLRGDLRQGGAVRGELAQVQVVDHLAQQVVDRLDQLHAGLVVAGHPEAVQHLLAEAVRRDDRRPVEVGQRAHEPPSPQRHLAVVGSAEVEHERVLAAGVEQPARGAGEPLAHPLPQLLRRRAAERREHQLRQLGATLRDVAGRQSRDGPGLPGAGAGLEHRRPGRQRAVGVEAQVEAHGAPTVSCASSGPHSRRASAPKRVPSGPGSVAAVTVSKDGGEPRT